MEIILLKNKIIEPMVPGMVAIDKDAIAAESDRRGTSTKSGTSYSEKTVRYSANSRK